MLPAACPWTVQQLLDAAFWPEEPLGLPQEVVLRTSVLADEPTEEGHRFVTAPEAAVILDCTTRTVRRLAASEALPGWRDAGGWWQFRLRDVLYYKRHRSAVPREA